MQVWIQLRFQKVSVSRSTSGAAIRHLHSSFRLRLLKREYTENSLINEGINSYIGRMDGIGNAAQ